MKSITAYSNSAATTQSSVFNYGDTIYFNASITLSIASTGTTITIKVYDISDSLQATALDTTYNFSTNTVADVKDDINSGTAPSVDLTGYAGGKYYATLLVSGSDVEDTYDKVFFGIVDAPIITNPTISDSTITFDTGCIIDFTVTDECDSAFVEFLNGSGNAEYAVDCVLTDNGDGTYAAKAITIPMQIPVDTYAAGDIVIHAINENDAITGSTSGSTDKTLSLAVTSSDGLKTGVMRWLNQVVEIKYRASYNDYGEGGYGSWTNVAARIVRNTQKIVDGQGQEIVSTAQTYISGENEITVDDKARFGGSDVAQILKVDVIPDADGNSTLKVIYT